VELLKECVQKSPSSSLYRYHLGMALLASGDKKRAQTELRAALDLRLDPEDANKTRRTLGTLRPQ
jgi:hypothetical protein